MTDFFCGDEQFLADQAEFEHLERRAAEMDRYGDWTPPALPKSPTIIQVVSNLTWCFTCDTPRSHLSGACTNCGQSIEEWLQENPDAPRYQQRVMNFGGVSCQ